MRPRTYAETAKAVRVLKMMERGDLRLSQFREEAILLIGMTQRGKTTTGYMLCQKNLRPNGRLNWEPHNPMLTNPPKIGTGINSETQIPNEFIAETQNGKVYIYDCPGYQDSYGCDRILSNGYFNYRVFSLIGKIRFVLVIRQADVMSSKNELEKNFEFFFKNFLNYEEIEKEILKALMIQISMTDHTKTERVIQNRFEELLRTSNPPLQDRVKKLLEFVVQNDRIITFRKPKNTVDEFNINDNLQKILKRVTPWERKVEAVKWERQRMELGAIEQRVQKYVDMSPINFSIADHIQNHPQKGDESFRRQWHIFNDYICQYFSKLGDQLAKIFQQLILITFGKQQCLSISENLSGLELDSYLNNNDLRSRIESITNFSNEHIDGGLDNDRRASKKRSLFERLRSSREFAEFPQTTQQLFWLKKIYLIYEIMKGVSSIRNNYEVKSFEQYLSKIKGICFLLQYIIVRGNSTSITQQKFTDFIYAVSKGFQMATIFLQMFLKRGTGPLNDHSDHIIILGQGVKFNLQFVQKLYAIFIDQPYLLVSDLMMAFKLQENLQMQSYENLITFLNHLRSERSKLRESLLKNLESRLKRLRPQGRSPLLSEKEIYQRQQKKISQLLRRCQVLMADHAVNNLSISEKQKAQIS